MSKTRSPDYPAIGLKDAIEKVRLVWTKDYQNKLPRAVVAEHMGYKGLNGASLPVLSALTKYGLLEGRGEETRVTDLALAIVAHEPGAPERVKALITASEMPAIFAELDGKFPGGKASESALRSYLLTMKFIPEAADTAIRAYRETKSLVEHESDGHSRYPDPKSDIAMHVSEPAARQPEAAYKAVFNSAGSEEPYRLLFTGGGIEITANITSLESADDLVRAVNALKVLLKPAGQGIRPESSRED